MEIARGSGRGCAPAAMRMAVPTRAQSARIALSLAQKDENRISDFGCRMSGEAASRISDLGCRISARVGSGVISLVAPAVGSFGRSDVGFWMLDVGSFRLYRG